MTQEEIIANNRLIAEFMGYEGQHEDWCGNNVLVDCEFSEGGKTMLPYNIHENWSWLMPAVTKIKHDKSCWITAEMNGIKDSIVPYINQCRPINQALLDVNLTTLYSAVIQFITWYNASKAYRLKAQEGEK